MSISSVLRRPSVIAFALTAVASVSLISVPSQAAPNEDSSVSRPMQSTTSAIVQLNGEPLATSVRTRPAPGKKIDFNSSAVRSYRAQLSALRNEYKAWLRVNIPSARITGNFELGLNAVSVELNGATLAQVSASALVKTAQYQGLYYPHEGDPDTDPDLAIIEATQAWQAAGWEAGAGAGVKVAIIDSGIDHEHPCFDDEGYEPSPDLGDSKFTNNKVIAARVFNNNTRSQRYTPEAIDSHGTHVAGTVACNFETPTVVDGVTLDYAMSGVAPRALLGNYNVFPGAVSNARSEDILNALDAAYIDGFDVANMSLGGGASGIQDLLTVAVDNLDRANMVVTISNGNEGPGYGTVGSPGSAARGLTAGASSVGHQLIHQITVGEAQYPAVKGDFGSGPVTAPLKVLADESSPFNKLSLACVPFGPGSLDGHVALISRGVCDFSVKMRNVQAAGGRGAIVVNREPGTLTMGTDGAPEQATIPGFMVDLNLLNTLVAADGVSVTLPEFGVHVVDAGGNDVIGDFTSWGPTDVDFRVKPDVMAPGVNVVSSIPRSYCSSDSCFAFFNGTSMAAPHLAGAAAIVRQQHPTWTAAQVRSAIVNTADRNVVRALDRTEIVDDANKVGTGRLNLLTAVQASVAVDPVSVSFGAVPSGSGKTLQLVVTLSNLTEATRTYTLQVVDPAASDVTFTVSNNAIDLAPGASGTVTVTLTPQKGASPGGKQAVLQVSTETGIVAHAMLFTLIK